MSILPPALFLHSPPHNWVIKCLDFLPSIYISILQLARHYVWILFVFYILCFSLNRTDEATKQRCVTHNKRQDGIRKCQCCFEETCSNNISPCAEICIVPCKNINSIMDVEVWIMGGVVLQDLVMLVLGNVQRNNIYVSQMYIMTVRKISFLFEFFFSLSLLKHPVK